MADSTVFSPVQTPPWVRPDGVPETPGWLREVEATAGWLSRDEALALHRYASEVVSGAIVEVGSYRGRSTAALSAGARAGVPVFAIEPHEAMSDESTGTFGPEDRAAFYRTMLRTGASRNVRLLNTSSEVLSPGWTAPVSLLFIDGLHDEPSVSRDWRAWRPHLVSGATVVFDDAHDPRVGPMHVIAQLVDEGTLVHRKNTGKMRALTYTGLGASPGSPSDG